MEYLRSHKSSGLVTIYVGQVLFTPFISCLELGWCFCESFLTSMVINQWEAINNTDNGKLHFEIDKRQHSVIGLYLKSILLSCHLLTFSSLTLPYHSSLSYLSSALFFSLFPLPGTSTAGSSILPRPFPLLPSHHLIHITFSLLPFFPFLLLILTLPTGYP